MLVRSLGGWCLPGLQGHSEKRRVRPKQVIVVRKDLNMRKGKLAAQVAHASMKFLLDGAVEKASLTEPTEEPTEWREWSSSPRLTTRELSDAEIQWLQGLFTKVVAYVTSEQDLLTLVEQGHAAGLTVKPIEDSGLTEFKGVKTLTCVAFGPDLPDKLDPVTRGLPLL